jgi:hypothetical protein
MHETACVHVCACMCVHTHTPAGTERERETDRQRRRQIYKQAHSRTQAHAYTVSGITSQNGLPARRYSKSLFA